MYRLDVALDLEILATEPYTGDYFLPEIKGLADASGVNYKASIYLTHHNHTLYIAYFLLVLVSTVTVCRKDLALGPIAIFSHYVLSH